MNAARNASAGFALVNLEKRREGAEADERPGRKLYRPIRDSRQTKRLFREYQKTRDPEVRNQICQSYLSLTSICAWRYAGRGVDFEDLRQEGCLGLLRAIDGFDPHRGVEFSTYATYFVEGHIRQYFRDKTWQCYVPRRTRLMAVRIKDLSNDLGRMPTKQEVIDLCGIPADKVDDAIAALQAWNSVGFFRDDLNTGLNPAIVNEISYVDEGFDRTLMRLDVERASEKALSKSEFSIVKMYYEDEMSQREIARKLGTYQMTVSRSLQRSAGKLGVVLGGKAKKAS